MNRLMYITAGQLLGFSGGLRYMVTCIWFPLIHVAGPEASGNSSYAWPLTVGGVIEPISKSKDRRFPPNWHLSFPVFFL